MNNNVSYLKWIIVILTLISVVITLYICKINRFHINSIPSGTLIVEDWDPAPSGNGMTLEVVDIDNEDKPYLLLVDITTRLNPKIISIEGARCAAWSPDSSVVAYSQSSDFPLNTTSKNMNEKAMMYSFKDRKYTSLTNGYTDLIGGWDTSGKSLVLTRLDSIKNQCRLVVMSRNSNTWEPLTVINKPHTVITNPKWRPHCKDISYLSIPSIKQPNMQLFLYSLGNFSIITGSAKKLRCMIMIGLQTVIALYLLLLKMMDLSRLSF